MTQIIVAFFKGREEGIIFPSQCYYTLITDPEVKLIIDYATKKVMYEKR